MLNDISNKEDKVDNSMTEIPDELPVRDLWRWFKKLLKFYDIKVLANKAEVHQ